MNASQDPRADWLGRDFWEQLERLEGRRQRIQRDHDNARRGFERLPPEDADGLRRAWRRYCGVIAELEQTAAEFEVLRR